MATLVWTEIHAPVETDYLQEHDPGAAADLIVDGAQPIGPEHFSVSHLRRA